MENQELIEVELGGQKVDVNKITYHFIEYLKLSGKKTESIQSIVSELKDFNNCLDQFQRDRKEKKYDTSNFQRFNLFHTIKPKSEYYHQQGFDDKKKPLLYPIFKIDKETVYSEAIGIEYPIKDCNLYTHDGINYIKIK